MDFSQGAFLLHKMEYLKTFIGEVKRMEEHSLSVRSITYAMKAQTLLSRYGIPCRIVRDRSVHRGCGYGIIVRGDLTHILALLKRQGIQVGKENT